MPGRGQDAQMGLDGLSEASQSGGGHTDRTSPVTLLSAENGRSTPREPHRGFSAPGAGPLRGLLARIAYTVLQYSHIDSWLRARSFTQAAPPTAEAMAVTGPPNQLRPGDGPSQPASCSPDLHEPSNRAESETGE